VTTNAAAPTSLRKASQTTRFSTVAAPAVAAAALATPVATEAAAKLAMTTATFMRVILPVFGVQAIAPAVRNP
jgi:hypothetical protein